MDATKATQLIAPLCKSFPNFVAWWEGMPQYTQDGVLEKWERQLEQVPEEAIAYYVDELVMDQTELPPTYDFDRLALLCKAWVKTKQLARFATERNTCTVCDGNGLVLRRLKFKVVGGKFTPTDKRYAYSWACNCSLGDLYAEGIESPLPRFNPEWDKRGITE